MAKKSICSSKSQWTEHSREISGSTLNKREKSLPAASHRFSFGFPSSIFHEACRQDFTRQTQDNQSNIK
jgi:hypothetical protein